jgi:hypothetical protein
VGTGVDDAAPLVDARHGVGSSGVDGAADVAVGGAVDGGVGVEPGVGLLTVAGCGVAEPDAAG